MNKVINTENLIIGSGIAGLTTALKLHEAGKQVTILTRENTPEQTNTSWAQGGIVFGEKDDSLIDDLQKASSHTSNLAAAEILLERSGAILKEVLIDKVKTPFTMEETGELSLTKEAAHSIERIIYHADQTGKAIQIALLNYLKDKVEFLTSHTAIDLITPYHHGKELNQRYEDLSVVGAYVFDQKNSQVKKIIAGNTILATGGVGSLYSNHSNTEGARGDGHAMAYRAGAFVTNMEFIQFHPTTFYLHSTSKRFLITEALRGEGGILLNQKGEAFMEKYHPDKELASRDIVSRAIITEMINDKADCVYLDISHRNSDWLKERFPTIYEYCLRHKVDLTKEPIPVVPAAHYSCGGVKTDLRGRTNLENLYAVGEVACTGLHGANRLASTSLLEGLTWGYIAAEDILSKTNPLYQGESIKDWEYGIEEVDYALIAQDVATLKQSMWNYVGVIRSKNRLSRARAMFYELQDEVSRFYKYAKLSDELIGLKSRVEVALMICNASLRNKISLGCFYRKD